MAEAVSAFSLPPTEALAFWRDRLPTPDPTRPGALADGEFLAAAEAARTRAFVVGGLTRHDLIAEVHKSLFAALAEGQTFRDWKAGISDVIAQSGLHPSRLETIFRTNVQAAYQAGRFKQMTETAEALPFWRYDAVNDSRTRPTHRALDGKIFPASHPFWKQWYPPNGYRCRCSVQALTARDIEERGLSVEERDPTGDIIEPKGPDGRPLPARPLWPDKGFSGNPAHDWLVRMSPEYAEPSGGRGESLIAKAVCRKGRGGAEFSEAESGDICKPSLATLDERHLRPFDLKDLLPKGLPVASYAAAFLEEFGLGLDESKVIRLPDVPLPVAISKGFFLRKSTGEWKGSVAAKGPHIRLAARTLLDPYEAWLDVEEKHSQGVVPKLRVIRLFRSESGRLGGFCSFHLVNGREWSAATAYSPRGAEETMFRHLEDQRKGVLLWREP